MFFFFNIYIYKIVNMHWTLLEYISIVYSIWIDTFKSILRLNLYYICIIYKSTCPFRENLSENNITSNTYIGHTTTTLSGRRTNNLSEISAIKQHLITKHNKDTDKLKSPDVKKVLMNNKKIIYKNNKNRLLILEVITIKNLKKTTINRIAFNTY